MSTRISGQTATAIPSRIQAQTSINKVVRPGGLRPSEVMIGIPPPPGEVIGDSYLEENWFKGSILLYREGDLIEGYMLKYDIEKDLFEIKTSADVKILEGRKAKSFLWQKDSAAAPHYFVNAKDYTKEGVPLTGFFEVLADGPMPLLKKTDIVIQKANYVKEFDTGSRDDKILKREHYYYLIEHNVNEIPNRKLASLFTDKMIEMDGFIRINGLNPKNESDLQRIFKEYNSLMSAKK
jgi:hypothetical protein